MTKRLKTNEFVEKAKEKHGDKYDYSKAIYENSRTKVVIICPRHGEFIQSPNNHLHLQGCPKCGDETRNKNFISNTNEFIEKAKIVHKNFYNYSKVIYIKASKKVTIICPLHGEFKQEANSHLMGHVCRKCANVIIQKAQTMKFSEFVMKANLIHGERYKYLVEYHVGGDMKIPIICSLHGVFKQTLEKHLIGQGCPKCRSSSGERIVRRYLEKLEIKYEEQKKFEGCRYKYLLRFDFYVPIYNFLIEFDGIQHYPEEEKIKYPRKKFTDLHVLIKDNIKTEWAKENNIPLLRIKYNENIHEKIDEFLMKLSKKNTVETPRVLW